MLRSSLQLKEFINPNILDEARIRDLSTPQKVEKHTFDAFYELLYKASVLAFSLTPQQTQVVNREQASVAFNNYHEAFLQFEKAFTGLAKQNPEQLIKYTMIINVLHQNKAEFEKAIRSGKPFTPIYSTNPQLNQVIAREQASGSATFNDQAFNTKESLKLGAEPVSKINAISPGVTWTGETQIPLDRN